MSSTPVKVPPSAANHSAATLDPDLRSQINAHLLKDGHVQKIQEVLLHSLHANKGDWPTLVQAHALNLLRSGEVTTFSALLARVLEDVRNDTQARAATHAKTNGAKATNGASSDPKPALAMPSGVVDDMLKVVRDSLDSVCEIEDTGPS
ncbi:hypothetical protein F5X68DRAFT_231923 [Plectosphaerella plurivora]|uniref:Uncharacterized protein n=1 Tax=Plectosphaerella plurivora TaxID=936078 RepID=A0A9P9AAK9_9PEZI|nr:hypothetical protein F5X68DRAFT_231923 [Plectosphaerella plurivora]